MDDCGWYFFFNPCYKPFRLGFKRRKSQSIKGLRRHAVKTSSEKEYRFGCHFNASSHYVVESGNSYLLRLPRAGRLQANVVKYLATFAYHLQTSKWSKAMASHELVQVLQDLRERLSSYPIFPTITSRGLTDHRVLDRLNKAILLLHISDIIP